MDFKKHNEEIVNLLMSNPGMIKNQAWRLENLYCIITKDGDKQIFKMNRAQRHFFETYLNIPKPYHRHCILKSRQLGFTTFIDIFILDSILFNTNSILLLHRRASLWVSKYGHLLVFNSVSCNETEIPFFALCRYGICSDG